MDNGEPLGQGREHWHSECYFLMLDNTIQYVEKKDWKDPVTGESYIRFSVMKWGVQDQL